MSELAILGGPPVINKPLDFYRSIGKEEEKAVMEVMKSGRLSEFIGAWSDEFYGGPLIQRLESDWCREFKSKYAISVNSNTSGLIAAMGAIGLSPGEEVIVPPWTMSATAMAPLFYGGIPVFSDIEPNYFCLDLNSVKENITEKTKAIIAVNLFGHPAELKELRELADAKGIYLIEDNAQAPLAKENERLTGTIGHIGVASLNYHKHIHTGEGGICTTEDSDLARRLQLIRNHGENVVNDLDIQDITNLVGFNFRMTELSAAVGISQIKKAKKLIKRRSDLANRLSDRLKDIDELEVPKIREGCEHVYYLWAAKINSDALETDRNIIAKAIEAEGCPTNVGYVDPLYNLPVFKRRVAIGNSGFPFNLSNKTYSSEKYPCVEKMHKKELIEFFICSYQLENNEIDLIADCYEKVFSNITALMKYKKSQFSS